MKNANRNMILAAAAALTLAVAPSGPAGGRGHVSLPLPPAPPKVLRHLPAPPPPNCTLHSGLSVPVFQNSSTAACRALASCPRSSTIGCWRKFLTKT